MKKKRLMTVAILMILACVVIGFTWFREQEKQKSGDIQVVATFYPMYEFTKNVVGDQGQVQLLMKAGTEPHDFNPSTKDLATIQKADALVYDNESMETWIPKVKKSIGKGKTDFIRATGNMVLLTGSEEEGEEGHEGHHHDYDPHVWLSPSRSIKLVETIRDSLSKKYPQKATIFKKNAAKYIQKLKGLDKDYASALTTAKQKSFITQHAAFAYLALDYGLNQIHVNGISAESEPSAQHLASLSQEVKNSGIKYVYFEENASSAVSETLAKEAGVETLVLNPIESLTQKQMDEGEDYFSIMRQNLKNLRKTTDSQGQEIPAKEAPKTVQKGYFKDSDVSNRTLSDWSGDWQSIYPYLKDGTLDQVWDYKAKLNKDMSAKAYKEYYTKGYKTDVEAISINGKKNQVTFTQNGKSQTFTYKYVGYKILTYKKGNRGVRYLFESKDSKAGEFKYIQFSDHNIFDTKAEHFHLFWGNSSQDAILKEMDNWPTYYPADKSGHDIAQDLVAHS
ncbi:metal ABC transporter solute-binding protein, Zn/Mn family [Streptococcus downei]|uniref:Surface adhesin n=1 Tax=Streptococcus downei MFe28 TaxID=764290 RepID=A0A380JHC7_STRDO|nr:zinc ABC transporter substrate-binding protein AdcA [Streptococcus downei]EFQ58229.1 ABC transporter, substrate-binding protein [Streptococcus downei F0415]SUN36888.1 surface adhesin [Streptococcus downei MFe28]